MDKLQIKVITSSPEGFWVNSSLIEGKKEAILIDMQFRPNDASRLAAAILESRKILTTIYVTHFHAYHYFGLTAIKETYTVRSGIFGLAGEHYEKNHFDSSSGNPNAYDPRCLRG